MQLLLSLSVTKTILIASDILLQCKHQLFIDLKLGHRGSFAMLKVEQKKREREKPSEQGWVDLHGAGFTAKA